jgi:hypothetical protein
MLIMWDRRCHLWREFDHRVVTQHDAPKQRRMGHIEIIGKAAMERQQRKPAQPRPLLDNGKGKHKKSNDVYCCQVGRNSKTATAINTISDQNSKITKTEHICDHCNDNTVGQQCMGQSCNDDSTNDSDNGVWTQ